MSAEHTSSFRRFLDRAVSRRTLLGAAPVAGAASLTGCAVAERPVAATASVGAHTAQQHAEGEAHGHEAPPPGYHFFTAEELRTLESMTRRLAIGTTEATAAVTLYIDRTLTESVGDATPVNVQVMADGPTLHPREVYHLGVPALDRYSQTRFGALFAALPTDRQDDVIELLEATGRRSGADSLPSTTALDQAQDVFGEVHPAVFVGLVRQHVTDGLAAVSGRGGHHGT